MHERWIAEAVGFSLLIAAVMAARRSQRRGDGFITTLGLFCFVWGAMLALFALPWVRYSTTPAGIWLTIYGSIATFIVGALAAQLRHGRLPRVEPERHERPDARRLRLTWIAFALISLVGFAAFVHAVDVVIGWRALFDDPATVRDIQTTSATFSDTYGPWKLLTYCNQIAFVLWTLGVRERCFKGRWRPAWVLGPLSLAPFVFTGDRTLMLLSLIWAAFFHLLYRPPSSPRRLAMGSVAAIVTLTLVFGVLGARVDKTIDSHPEIGQALTTHTFDSLALPYVYLTGNAPTFAALVDDPLRPHTRGQMTLLPAVKILHGIGLWGQPPESVGAFYPIPFETFNNYSWLGTFYLDFGVVGCILLPLLIGYLATALVLRAVRRRTLLSVWSASLLLYCVAFTPMLAKFSDTLTWQYLLAGPFVVGLIRQKPHPRELIERLAARARARPRPAVAVVLATAGISLLALVSVLSAGAVDDLPASRDALGEKLERAARRAAVTRVADVYPTPNALASRLHVRDPGTKYVALPGADAVAPAAQSIGVFTTGGRLVLRARSGDTLVSVDTASLDKKLVTVAPGGEAELGQNLVVNGGFEDGYSGWDDGVEGVARAALTTPGYGSRRAIAITGTGERGVPKVLRQVVHVRADRGACFSFSVRSRRVGLSRPLLVWASLTHSDGRSDQLRVGDGGRGLPRGTGRWRRFQVLGRATAPIRSIVVFAADSGEAALRGAADVDDIAIRKTGGPGLLSKLKDVFCTSLRATDSADYSRPAAVVGPER